MKIINDKRQGEHTQIHKVLIFYSFWQHIEHSTAEEWKCKSSSDPEFHFSRSPFQREQLIRHKYTTIRKTIQ